VLVSTPGPFGFSHMHPRALGAIHGTVGSAPPRRHASPPRARGDPELLQQPADDAGVHPRAGGGHDRCRSERRGPAGSSPLARGSRAPWLSVNSLPMVHPRFCGVRAATRRGPAPRGSRASTRSVSLPSACFERQLGQRLAAFLAPVGDRVDSLRVFSITTQPGYAHSQMRIASLPRRCQAPRLSA